MNPCRPHPALPSFLCNDGSGMGPPADGSIERTPVGRRHSHYLRRQTTTV
ncbi:hypothetical protein Y88_3397 [Novosphingobium nitrogenifigens DSM 19370]|uniref:Uncharacterized protein n=1 Tax=Novosphingobium nitrogenifigens DSM 19370 TaxID=983920 RepID=F1Z3C0_9SPHN|nr:hypothetical protein Y88_3397 [Novosphingobium nitrogenifigens DSM 19370]